MEDDKRFMEQQVVAVRLWIGPVDIPHVQGQRNPSKMVGTERGIRGQTD